MGCLHCTGLFSCQHPELHHAEIDWELTSLTNQHFGHAFGDSSGGHAAVHAAASQDNGSGNDANANAFMAAVAMHAIVSADNQAHGEW